MTTRLQYLNDDTGAGLVTTGGGTTAYEQQWLEAVWTLPTGAPIPDNFEVAFFTGSDPTATDVFILPIQEVPSSDRSLVVSISALATLTNVRAAVRSVYGGVHSAWAVVGSGVTATAVSHALGGSGTVTDVSVATADGFAGSVATSTTTPVITIKIPSGITINPDAAGSGADWAYHINRPTSGMTAAVTLTLPIDDGTTGQSLITDGAGALSWSTISGGGGSGTVTTVSVVSANGFTGNVANPTTTPAITLTTSITGILQGNGTAISAASVTGTGNVVQATSPTLVTPILGAASATSIDLPNTTTSTTGIIFKGGAPWAHNYAASGTAGKNVFIGNPSGNFTLTGSSSGSQGSYNVGLGDDTLTALTTGLGLTAIGAQALKVSTSGILLTGVGVQALFSNTTGYYNDVLGSLAMYTNTTGYYNTALATIALYYCTSGYANFAGGVQSLYLTTTGYQNIGIGMTALYDLTTGHDNVAVGYATGFGITSGYGNTILGAGISGLSGGLTNNIILASGNTARATFDGTDWAIASTTEATSSAAGSQKLSGGLAVAKKIIAGGQIRPGTFTVATLPAGANGDIAFATDGRKIGELITAGTGSLVVYSNGQWRRLSDETTIAA